MTDLNLSVSATRQLQYIPLEISAHVARFLDQKSALSLAMTCTSLRPAGEIIMYKRLDLTGSWTPPEPMSARRYYNKSDYLIRFPIVEAKLRSILSALTSSPERIDYIQEVRLEPYDGVADHLIELISLIAHRIQRLDILPFPYHPRWGLATNSASPSAYSTSAGRSYYSPSPTDPDWGSEERARLASGVFYTSLNDANLPFPRLTHLKLAYVETAPTPVVDTWMQRMTNVQTLEFSSAYRTYELPLVKQPTPIPSFENLRTLTLDNLYVLPEQYGLDILATLLEMSPNLETLRLRGEWKPRTNQRAIRVLGKMEKLKRVVTQGEEWYRGEGGPERIRGIDSQKLGKAGLGVEEMAVDLHNWDENQELYLEDLPIPNASALRRVTVMTSPRPSLSEYADVAVGKTPLQTLHTPAHFLHHLGRAPLLSRFMFLHHPNFVPSAYYSDFIEPELFVDPSRWADGGGRGIIVRQFHHPASGEDFWHIRTLSRATQTQYGAFVGSRRVWRDMTDFKNRTVPRLILDRMYPAIGGKSDFLDGGRGLSLGPAGDDRAWDILRNWRVGLEEGEDQSDEKDRMNMAGIGKDRDLRSEGEWE